MEKIQVDKDEYIIYSPDSLKFITDNMLNILDESLNFYKSLFDIDDFRKIQINYFDNIEKFREYTYSIRDSYEPLPEYAQGNFDKGMINAYINPNIMIDTPLYNKKLHMASHELFHIMYQELIWEKENKKRIVWFDEGMAQLLSGEYKDILNDVSFENWLNNVITLTKEISDLNSLVHGVSFETNNYSGYKLSLLAVKYLFDLLGIDQFKELMHNPEKIEEYGNNIIENSFNWYKENKRISAVSR